MTVKASYEVHETFTGPELWFRGDWSGKTKADMPKETLDRVSLYATEGWVCNGDISFLCHLPKVRSLNIHWYKPIDLNPLTKLKYLRNLELELHPTQIQRFDFSKTPNLLSLSIHWNKGFTGIQSLKKLKTLAIHELSGVRNLDLSGLSKLSELELVTGGSLRELSLKGIPKLKKMIWVGLPKLEKVNGFEAGDSVNYLDLRRVKTVPPSFWKKFVALKYVETTM